MIFPVMFNVSTAETIRECFRQGSRASFSDRQNVFLSNKQSVHFGKSPRSRVQMTMRIQQRFPSVKATEIILECEGHSKCSTVN